MTQGTEDGPPVVMYTAGRTGIPENETTWATMLKSNGYKTAAIGKPTSKYLEKIIIS